MQIAIELVSGICNSKCLWCFSQYKTGKQVHKGMMSFLNLKTIIDINKEMWSVIEIIPFSHGEALLNPDFIKCVEYIHYNDITLSHLHSNFSMTLTDDHFKVLNYFKTVSINIGGIDKYTHYKNMNTDLNVVWKNLERLIYWKKKLGSKTLIILKMVLNKNNIHQDIKPIAEKYGIACETYPLYFTTSDSNDEDKLEFIKNNLDRRVSCRDKYKVKNNKITITPKTKECTDSTLTIRYNGNVQMCCRARSQHGIVANALNTPIKSMFNLDTYKIFKELMKIRMYIPYCKYCS